MAHSSRPSGDWGGEPVDRPLISISVRGFRKRFSTTRATTEVSCVDWTADNSLPVWLKGANGSGKTTLLKSIAGWIVSFEGAIEIDGVPVHTLWAPEPRIALFPATDFLPAGQSFDAFTANVARNAGIDSRAFARAVREEQERLGAGSIATQQRDGWSTGERKLLSLALFFGLGRPVKLLDEPFAALDDAHRELLASRMLLDVQAGHFVLYTDHREETSLDSLPIPLKDRA